MRNRLRIIVTGLIAQHPSLGGVTWDYLQYAVGLARLGHDVYYVEDSGEWPYTLDGGPSGSEWNATNCTANIEYLAECLERYGLADRWAYHFPMTSTWYGLPDSVRREVIATADLLLNVSGTLVHPDRYAQVGRLAYIDSDPVFTQLKIVTGDLHFAERVDNHHVHFSFGESFSPNVPVTGHHWRPTRQPIVLSEWHAAEAPRQTFTTVMNWTSYKPIEHQGRLFGQKDIEFSRFLDLPSRLAGLVALEVGLGRTHRVDWESVLPETALRHATALAGRSTPQALLTAYGWNIVDPAEKCAGLDAYRQYLQTSMGEWSVAKHGYVEGQAGWFSCRSACYLAAGRPVVVQDTGFRDVLPTGEGVLSFRDLQEATDSIRAVCADYTRHAKAARALAEEYFDSAKVLSALIDTAMSSVPESPR